MNEGTLNLQGMSMSRSYPPITLQINWRRIFGKGTNWLNPEVFPGTITRERYDELLNRALSASFRPVLASARIPHFRWAEGEMFTCDLYLLNDHYEKVSGGKISAKKFKRNYIELILEVEGHPEMNLSYKLIYKPKLKPQKNDKDAPQLN